MPKDGPMSYMPGFGPDDEDGGFDWKDFVMDESGAFGDDDTLLDEFLTNIGTMEWERKDENVNLEGAGPEATAALDVLGQGVDWTEVAQGKVDESKTPVEEKEAKQLGQYEEEKGTKKQAFLKGIANFLAVFTAKDPGTALMSLIQTRVQQMESEKMRKHDIDKANLAHQQAMEKQDQAHQQSMGYLGYQNDLYLRNQAYAAQQAAELEIKTDVIDDRFNRALKNVGINDQADMAVFRAGLNGVMQEYTTGLSRETGQQISKERLRQQIAQLAMAGAPADVLRSMERIALGNASDEDYKNANRWQTILSNMTDKDMVRQMHMAYTSSYLDLAQRHARGEISDSQYFYMQEGLDNSYRNLGYGGYGGVMDKMKSQFGINKTGPDPWQQNVIATGYKMLNEGRFEDFTDLVNQINTSPPEDWQGMPDMKKKEVLDSLSMIWQRFDQMADQMARDRMQRFRTNPGNGFSVPSTSPQFRR